MAPSDIRPTGRERTFGVDRIIVSKTDCKGHVTYANDVFLEISGFTEEEILGQPHNVIRHPDMPRCVFQLLWETIESGREIFAYVLNMAKNGDHYWVLAHVTPTFDAGGAIVGYHSNRRSPEASVLAKVRPLYQGLLAEEKKYPGRKEGQAAGTSALREFLRSTGME
jgi:PAS domain S-box-containing protein